MKRCVVMFLLCALQFLSILSGVSHAFLFYNNNARQSARTRLLFSTPKNADHNNNKDDEQMQQLRQLLETSWNQPLMGHIPTTPAAAAVEISDCLLQTAAAAVAVVDLQLPSLQPGSRWYDVVFLADVARLLVERLLLEQKSTLALLLVRDDATVQSIQRVWKARSSEQSDRSNEEETDDDSFIMYDDFADVSVASIASAESPQPASSISSSSTNRIQLASLFGNDTVSQGADMEDHVIRSLQKNVLPLLINNTVICILSPVTRSEIHAVCLLVQTYYSTTFKKFILLNPQLPTPRPRALQHADMVYSLRPYVVRQRAANQETVMQIVVLKRRNEWQVFVSSSSNNNNNSGQLERLLLPPSTAGHDDFGGPSMEWVTLCAMKYLQNKSNNNNEMQ